jgi:hypothetical protein
MQSGIRARYSVAVAVERSVDRGAWAGLVVELMNRETKGKKLPFAKRVGVNPRTVDRWIREEVSVTHESVRQVAERLDLSAMDLLVKVGYYRAGEMAPPRAADPYDDPVIQEIMADPHWTDDERSELVEKQLKQMEEDQRRRLTAYEQLVRLSGRGREAS